MILTKLESPNLDLQNWRYKFYKTVLKSKEKNYPSNFRSLTRGTHRSVGPACHRHQNRGGGSAQRGSAELADGGFTGDEEGTTVSALTSRID